MGKHCQDRYTHSLPPDLSIKTGRINLTFRNAKGENQYDEMAEKLKRLEL
jgi:hypothetical protein